MRANEIWVLAECREGGLTRASFQLIEAARRLAAERKLDAVAVLLGGSKTETDELAGRIERVLWLQHEQLTPYEATRAMAALWQLLQSRGTPVAILAPASAAGLELAPRLAARCHGGYAGGCVATWWEGDRLAARRPVFGGRVYEELAFATEPAVLTVRSGAFAAAAKLATPGQVQAMPIEMAQPPAPSLLDRQRTAKAGQDVSEASRVVAGGRGMGAAENFKLLEELASVVGGSVGASRAVVDAGLRPLDEQVGKSGKTISPELYIACGISGAIHHILGMNTSKVVVAINSDPEAPIFKNADFGLVEDALKAIPELTKLLRQARSG